MPEKLLSQHTIYKRARRVSMPVLPAKGQLISEKKSLASNTPRNQRKLLQISVLASKSDRIKKVNQKRVLY
jgi:hypothetical protein